MKWKSESGSIWIPLVTKKHGEENKALTELLRRFGFVADPQNQGFYTRPAGFEANLIHQRDSFCVVSVVHTASRQEFFQLHLYESQPEKAYTFVCWPCIRRVPQPDNGELGED